MDSHVVGEILTGWIFSGLAPRDNGFVFAVWVLFDFLVLGRVTWTFCFPPFTRVVS